MTKRKLIRDDLPTIMAKEGSPNITEMVKTNSDDYRNLLREKLIEETTEVIDALQNKTTQDMIEEIADVQEVLIAIMAAYRIETFEVDTARAHKYVERGGFMSGAVLIY